MIKHFLLLFALIFLSSTAKAENFFTGEPWENEMREAYIKKFNEIKAPSIMIKLIDFQKIDCTKISAYKFECNYFVKEIFTDIEANYTSGIIEEKSNSTFTKFHGFWIIEIF